MTTRIGFIGAGGIAHAHARAMAAEAARTEVVAIYDVNPAQAASLAKGLPSAEVAATMEAFWRIPMDAVWITVPNYLHLNYVVEAANRGLAVFCEKPMANSVAEAEAMLAAVSRAGVVHLVGFKNRYFPAVQQLKQLIDSGALGDLYAYREICTGARLTNPGIGMEWRMDVGRAGGGAVADFGSHSLDMANWLLGPSCGALFSLSARLATFIPREGIYPSNDDMAIISGRFATGALLTILDSRVGPGLYQVEVYGANGYAVVDMAKPDRLTVVTYAHASPIELPASTATEADPFRVQLRVFLDALKTGKPVEPHFGTGLKVQRWIDMAVANGD
jgi:predicted dehydrogenase